MDRRFPIENGHQVIACGACGAKGYTGRKGGRGGGALPPQAIASFFAAQGWRIGQTARKDRCPACHHPRKISKGAPEVAADPRIDTIVPPQPGASARPPRVLEREDRRLIFAKLEEVYVDENTGYTAGWNDDAVARDMNVPRAWVEEIREQNFGPQKASQSAEVQAIDDAIRAVEAQLADAAPTLTGLGRAMEGVREDQKRLDGVFGQAAKAIEKIKADLAKLTGRV